MSINKSQRDCQPASTLLSTVLDSFWTRHLPNINHRQPLKLNLTGPALPLFASSLTHRQKMPLAIITANIKSGQLLLNNLTRWQSLFNPDHHWHLISGQLADHEISGQVITSLRTAITVILQHKSNHHLIIPADLLTSLIPNPKQYQNSALSLHTGQRLSLNQLIKLLIELGYTRQSSSLDFFTFQVQGENIHLRDTHQYSHVITFFGDVIETITRQAARSLNLASLNIQPAILPAPSLPLIGTLSDFIILHPHLPDLSSRPRQIITSSLSPDLEFPFYQTNPQSLTNQPTVIFYQNHDRVINYTAEHNLHQTILCRSDIALINFTLTSPSLNLATEASLIPESKSPAPLNTAQGLTLIAQLTPNKPAVHADHGIGIFEGLVNRTIGGLEHEYLILRYAAGDTLSVPVEYAHKVTAYVGQTTPPIARLGSPAWTKSKKQASHDAARFAQELIQLTSRRQQTPGRAYHIDSQIEQQLNDSFPYELTADQLTAWTQIKSDLARPQPLDRLVVGDVGFGKTELAVRAARHAVHNGLQVAVLAPTTLLVQQHASTFASRLPDLSNRIKVLSRFSTPAEQTQTRQAILKHQADIVIGTHALLSHQTTWSKLGLVIIDEEQRFGVKQKAHFKQIRSDVDLLSLSATPIPRTLSMALSGLTNLSVISSAPAGRKSIKTFTSQDTDDIITQALTRELGRKGQAYVVAPRVRQIPALLHRLTKLFPQARISAVHGQLPPRQLAHLMREFYRGDLDVLVTSTIIESGIDLPNANTIIITQATHFGLSDLYQLRGRVGRRQAQGYAYFLYNQGKLTTHQRQRLTALTEASRLGSGWSIAQRDLEIRGAGNLLGAEQSGSVSTVGIQLYLDLVNEAIDRAAKPTTDRRDVNISLPLTAHLPTHYIADSHARTNAYGQLSRAPDLPKLDQAITRITSQYGPPPPETRNLFALIKLQHLAAEANITDITSTPITPPGDDPFVRLTIITKHPSSTLKKLDPMGLWELKDNSLTRDFNTINLQVLNTLNQTLS